MSDETHLTNFSGDKKIWPIYMTIGNILADIRNKPSSVAIVLLDLLPIPPRVGNLTSAEDSRSKELRRSALHEALTAILTPLEATAKDEVFLQCPDSQIWQCYPVLAAWPADYMEYVKLFNIKTPACPVCCIPGDKLGRAKPNPFPERDHLEYQRQ